MRPMTPSEQLQQELEDLTHRSRPNIEAIIAESQATIDQFEQMKWYLAAETTAAEHVGRLIEHRDRVVTGLMDRLYARLPASPPEPLVTHMPPPAPPQAQPTMSEEQALSEVIRHINHQRSQQQRNYG